MFHSYFHSRFLKAANQSRSLGLATLSLSLPLCTRSSSRPRTMSWTIGSHTPHTTRLHTASLSSSLSLSRYAFLYSRSFPSNSNAIHCTPTRINWIKKLLQVACTSRHKPRFLQHTQKKKSSLTNQLIEFKVEWIAIKYTSWTNECPISKILAAVVGPWTITELVNNAEEPA